MSECLRPEQPNPILHFEAIQKHKKLDLGSDIFWQSDI